MKRERREQILDYLHSLENKRIYSDELYPVKKKCFSYMNIDDSDFIDTYSLNVFNGFLDDFFAKGKNRYECRFCLRDDDKITLPDGSLNPHRFESYWILQ